MRAESTGIDDGDVLILIMDYLKRKQLMSTMCTLEEETGVQAQEEIEELKTLKELVLKGKWEEAESFLQMVEPTAKQQYDQALFVLRKQMFMELLDEGDKRPELGELVQVLKGLEELCDKAEFKELCFFLTLTDIRQQPEFKHWTATGGRYAAYDSMSGILTPLFSSPGAAPAARRPEGPCRLEVVLSRGVRHQADSIGAPHGFEGPLLRDATPDDVA
eukprot:CAMPEP_0174916706 /NCGR_PEP_ID=MMETSP1355-20121228/1990_1 /TAXON_ID=464990 /ORGANISM="Hemiselmis tepida, Strain CCMP443" /LENGTH=217 /DNA_ID=CAMNT_0016161735 /DNA_START=15 /DNA_END=664 /DNA_ORIENTATION=-